MKRPVISSRVLRTSLAIATGIMLSVSLLPAQVDTETVLGTVSDTSRAVLRGAEVTLTNEGTNAKLTTTAEPDGTYKFTPVGIGTYSLTAISQGFQTTTRHGLTMMLCA